MVNSCAPKGLADYCDSDKIRHFLVLTDLANLYILTLFSKLLIRFYWIRTLFFQLSFGHNGQLICRANSIIMNYVTYCFWNFSLFVQINSFYLLCQFNCINSFRQVLWTDYYINGCVWIDERLETDRHLVRTPYIYFKEHFNG